MQCVIQIEFKLHIYNIPAITSRMVFFIYGIILSLIGSSLQAVGLCVWKLHSISSNLNVDTNIIELRETHATPLLPIPLPKHTPKKICFLVDNKIPWIWVAGLCSFAIGNIFRLCCSGNRTSICGDSAWELVFGREYLLGKCVCQ